MTTLTAKSAMPAPGGHNHEIDINWGAKAPRGAVAVFNRMIKEGANVPLFLSQTLVNALRDVGYNDTTSATCEHVDNAYQWGATEVRVYFVDTGKRGKNKIDVIVLDNGCGMAPNVLRAVTAFGGSMNFDNRDGIGRYGMGMKAAALSMSPTVEIYSWQEQGAYYRMILDVENIGSDKSNSVNLPAAEFLEEFPLEIREALTKPMSFPKDESIQGLIARDHQELRECLGDSGTLIYIPDCDRLTHRTARSLVEHATKTMARIYRKLLAGGRSLFINNRKVEPFDPMYYIPSARHVKIPDIKETQSRLVHSTTVHIPVAEYDGNTTYPVTVRLFRLPIEAWSALPRKILKSDLHLFEIDSVSFVRADREVYSGHITDIVGKRTSTDPWWRLEIDFPPVLDEAFGVNVNKQGVRLKNYVCEAIKKQISEELRYVKENIKQHWAQRAAEDAGPKLTEAEKRANEAEALQATLFPSQIPQTEEAAKIQEENLRALAVTLKRNWETDEEAYTRIKDSRFLTDFKHDEDAPFYRVDSRGGKVILTVNTAHQFFEKIYKPLASLSKQVTQPGVLDEMDGTTTIVEPDLAKAAAEAITSLQLLLLSLARTQSVMEYQDNSGEHRTLFGILRRQWSLNLETMLVHN